MESLSIRRSLRGLPIVPPESSVRQRKRLRADQPLTGTLPARTQLDRVCAVRFPRRQIAFEVYRAQGRAPEKSFTPLRSRIAGTPPVDGGGPRSADPVSGQLGREPGPRARIPSSRRGQRL